MSIPEPKVEHHEGRGIRSSPIFPELRPILDEAFDIFGDRDEYVKNVQDFRVGDESLCAVRVGCSAWVSSFDLSPTANTPRPRRHLHRSAEQLPGCQHLPFFKPSLAELFLR